MAAENILVLVWHCEDDSSDDLSTLVSAEVSGALRRAGCESVWEVAFRGDRMHMGQGQRPTVVFPVTTGRASTGWLQRQLEAARVPFAGSGSRACAVAHDPLEWRSLLTQAGVPVRTHGNPEPMRRGDRRFSMACIGLGVQAITLPIIEIVEALPPDAPIQMYQPWHTQFVLPASMDEPRQHALLAGARAVHELLGCIVSRTEAHLSDDGRVTVSACEAAPLLLPKALLARAAAASGMGFAALVKTLLDLGLASHINPTV